MQTEKQTILIVDDQPANIRILVEELQSSYNIKAAISGAVAMELVQQTEKPDLILLDVMMPDMDGYEVCRRLKDNVGTKDIPIIFVTAHTDSAEEAFGLNLGAVDYISKPYSMPIIMARIRNNLIMKRKTDLLEALVSLDGLTGIYNRRRFDETYYSEWRRAIRSRQPLSIVMMDIDHFKEYNDNYGHGSGDECLQRVANCLSSCVSRPGDLVARYGGEEFVALLPQTDLEGTKSIAARFVGNVSALFLPHIYSDAADHVTISAGIATVTPSKVFDPAEFLAKADENLYRAKNEGRNRFLY